MPKVFLGAIYRATRHTPLAREIQSREFKANLDGDSGTERLLGADEPRPCVDYAPGVNGHGLEAAAVGHGDG
jgi:hypothetical protein